MKPFKRSHTGPKRLNALGMAGALGDDGPTTPDAVESDNDHSLVDEDGTRAQRFATDLQGNRFREVSTVSPGHIIRSKPSSSSLHTPSRFLPADPTSTRTYSSKRNASKSVNPPSKPDSSRTRTDRLRWRTLSNSAGRVGTCVRCSSSRRGSSRRTFIRWNRRVCLCSRSHRGGGNRGRVYSANRRILDFHRRCQ